MKTLGIDYFKTLKFEGREALIKKVKYEGNGTYTVTVDDFENKTVCEFIEDYKTLHFDLEYQKLENKRLKCIIKEHENLAKELDDKIKKFLPRK
tara:strand:+ start:188 stop:469 length:282 start_codon:yes stop_codon:yes gene_type:complete